jgi:predicted Zn-dependent protease
MTEGVGVHSTGDAQMKLIANEILLMENEIGVNKFNHLFEAYSQPAVASEKSGKKTEKKSRGGETKSQKASVSSTSEVSSRKKRLETASKRPPRRAGVR